LVAEIVASSASYDLHDKKEAYRRNGVQEYLVWQVFERKVDWYRLQDGEYELLQPDQDGVVKSQVFPGLWLAVPALLAGEMATVLAVLQTGLSSPDHAEFVEALATKNP
jgi:Uma2 family endonuclease